MKLTKKQNAQKRGLLVSPSKFIDIATASTAIAGIIKRDLRRGIGKDGAMFMESIMSKGRILSRSESASLIPLQPIIFMDCLVDKYQCHVGNAIM